MINDFESEETCDACGRPESELKPFGKSGDPLKGNFEGKKLVCRRRFYYERYNGEYDRIADQLVFDGKGRDNLVELIAKYGEEKANGAYMYYRLQGMTRKSMECRDCIIKLRSPLMSSEDLPDEETDILTKYPINLS